LQLVTDTDPGSGSVFDNLDALRQELPSVATRRARSVETFARIPHARGHELARRKLSGAAWALLIELDRLILMGRGRNPVRLTYRAREAIGLSRHRTDRALRQLVATGVITIEQRAGRVPLVTHKWFPIS
jgi:hypothetical protein